MVRRETVSHGRSDTPAIITAVKAGSCAGGHVLVGKLEVFSFFSGSEFVVLFGGVVSAFNVSTAVNFDLRGKAVKAGSTSAASPCVVSPGATSPAATTTTDRRHAAPVPAAAASLGVAILRE